MSVKIKAYYCWVDAFKDVNYDGYVVVEEDNKIKTILFKDVSELSSFLLDNNLTLHILHGIRLIVRKFENPEDDAIFGKLEEI